jgi:hypothetical protein
MLDWYRYQIERAAQSGKQIQLQLALNGRPSSDASDPAKVQEAVGDLLDVAQGWWGSVRRIELCDECKVKAGPNLEYYRVDMPMGTMMEWIHRVNEGLAARTLTPPPQGYGASVAVDADPLPEWTTVPLEIDGKPGLAYIAIEAYLPRPGLGSTEDNLSHMFKSVEKQMKAVPCESEDRCKGFLLVGQSYARGDDTCTSNCWDPDQVRDLQLPTYLMANGDPVAGNKLDVSLFSRIMGLSLFSYGRQTGVVSIPMLATPHRSIGERILGVSVAGSASGRRTISVRGYDVDGRQCGLDARYVNVAEPLPVRCGDGICAMTKTEDCETCPEDCKCKSCDAMGLGWYRSDEEASCNTACDGGCVMKKECDQFQCLDPGPHKFFCYVCPWMNRCGDGFCQPAHGETCETCPEDGCCPPATKGCGEMGPGWYQPDHLNDCEQDCGAGECVHKIDCGGLRCRSDVPGQDYCLVCPFLNRCGDGACQPARNENCNTCPVDCGTCGGDPPPPDDPPATNSCGSQGFYDQSGTTSAWTSVASAVPSSTAGASPARAATAGGAADGGAKKNFTGRVEPAGAGSSCRWRAIMNQSLDLAIAPEPPPRPERPRASGA